MVVVIMMTMMMVLVHGCDGIRPLVCLFVSVAPAFSFKERPAGQPQDEEACRSGLLQLTVVVSLCAWGLCRSPAWY